VRQGNMRSINTLHAMRIVERGAIAPAQIENETQSARLVSRTCLPAQPPAVRLEKTFFLADPLCETLRGNLPNVRGIVYH
jgi:hypothetical protein